MPQEERDDPIYQRFVKIRLGMPSSFPGMPSMNPETFGFAKARARGRNRSRVNSN
jgi:hypothetical protein